MHELLIAQLREYMGGATDAPAELAPFLDAVDRTYRQADSDRVEFDHAVSLLSATLQSTAEGILVIDRAGAVVQMNRKFVELWDVADADLSAHDRESALQFVLEPLADPERFLHTMRELNGRPDAHSFNELTFKDGRIFEQSSQPQRIGGDIVGRVRSFRDVTERRQLEAQLRQSQKMEAIGALAGGVAHDFNNLLTVIRGNADLLREAFDTTHEQSRDVQEITVAADRAATLVQQLLTFSRKQNIQPVQLDLNDVVTSLAPMLERLIGEHIGVEIATAPGLHIVTADAGQMEQALVNLVVNARDAMPKGGRISIATQSVVLDENRTFGITGGNAKRAFVLLSVSDTGHGIAVEHRTRIFEPFFTTKSVGKGTGLGLSTVFGIVQQCGGHILLESEIGQGSTFKLYLPRAAHDTPTPPSSVPSVPAVRGSETVLVVEDEEAVRGFVQRSLERRGYTVIAAADGEEAVRLASRHADEIQLLITDMIMPGSGGAAVAEEVRRFCPDVHVLYMSGYSDEFTDRNATLGAHAHFLEKPFTVGTLAVAVRAALNAPA